MAIQVATLTAAQTTAGGASVPALNSSAQLLDAAGAVITYRPTLKTTALTYAATMTADATTADVFSTTLTGPVTFDFINGVNGQILQLQVKQDATGSRLVTWGTSIAFGTDITSAGATPSTAANATDLYWFQYDSGSSKYRMIRFARGY